MTTVIAIRGHGQQGKTSTLRRAIERMEEHYQTQARFVIPEGSLDATAVLDTALGKIGVTTQGDPNTNPHKRVKRLAEEEQCKVVLCATRTRGATVTDLVSVCNEKGWRLLWWSNIVGPSLHAGWNDLSAQYVVGLVNLLMTRKD